MKTVSIIGDCHLARLYEHHPESQENIKFWGTAGLRAFEIDFKKLSEVNKLSSGTEIGNKDPVEFQEVENSELIVLWIGYVDIRQNLPKYKNSEKIAKKYVENAISFFKNKDILFIEPLPQFDKMYLRYEGISPEYSYEERLKQNNEFNFYLSKYVKEAGLKEPISQKLIFDALGVDDLDSKVLRTIAPHPMDALSEGHNRKLYNFFLKVIEENI
jgi:hypothetical protein